MNDCQRLPIKTDFGVDFFRPESKEIIVSSETKCLWAVVLDLFVEFDRVCKKHSIKYCLGGGSVLGAIRHGGFIPWDDDMDIAMTRGEYEKLCAVAPAEFRSPYFFQTNETDPGSARGHAQLRNSHTTAILKGEMGSDGRPMFRFNQGVFLDIMPHDILPDDPLVREKFICEVEQIKQRIVQIKRCHYILDKRSYRDILCRKIFFLVRMMILEKTTRRDLLDEECKKLDEVCGRYNDTASSLMADISCFPSLCRKRRLYRDMFENLTVVKYCGMDVPVPAHYEDYLTACYGDWRRHVVGGSQHGGMFVDVNRPYTEYIKK